MSTIMLAPEAKKCPSRSAQVNSGPKQNFICSQRVGYILFTSDMNSHPDADVYNNYKNNKKIIFYLLFL
jgi:hypothetical protein